MRRFIALALLACTVALGAGARAAEAIPVRISETVELLSIVFRIAGADEYRMADANAPYVKEVDARFGALKEHEVAKVVHSLRESRGIGFDAVMSMAVHLKDARTLEPKLPWDQAGDTLEKRWTPADAERFVKALRAFVAESNATEFFDSHADYYKQAADRLASQLTTRPYRAWLDGFFGQAPGLEFGAIVGLLNGSGNYGVSVRYPDGRSEICPVIGASEFDAQGLPTFDEGDAGLIVHEFSHTYTNPLVDKFASGLLPPAQKMYPTREALMKPQAYGTPMTMIYESMVRACTVRFMAAHGAPAEMEKQIAAETGRGFLWTRDLAALLGEYEKDRAAYPTLEAFMPRVVAFFEHEAKTIDERLALLPRVVRISPADGATNVDPATTELVVEFDRPMRRTSCAVTGSPDKTPKANGQFRFSEDGKTFTLPVTLEPGKAYSFGLNSVYRSGFVSEAGWPLDPVTATFTTAGK